ncbi:hypothetical protein [Microbispora triticiradicis]|uniref:hypothetical protein n=1 Tax=Microbispora triticiradicis TaxID=2200763 RepID=UPI001AD75EF4|nr:hypothetical protein [Microbispora triticiradicis]MBO4272596.1 hypothetical protein [Microbispora triticiradicis]
MRDRPAVRVLAPLALAIATVLAITAAWSVAPPVADAAALRADGGDRNGNRALIRVGNGIDNTSHLAVGSAKNSGIQQQTIGVGGVSNSQSTACRRWFRRCEADQRIWASNQQNSRDISPRKRHDARSTVMRSMRR